MSTKSPQSDVSIDILELVQNVFEQPQFARKLIELMPLDLQPAMQAVAIALDNQDQAAAQTALAALCGALEG